MSTSTEKADTMTGAKRRVGGAWRAIAMATLSFGSLALGSIASMGCRNVQTDFCDAVCECQNCGEKGQERCDINVQGQLDTAEVYGCLSQAEQFFDCVIESSACSDGEFDPQTGNCEDERKDYDDCTRDSSRRDPGPY